MHIAGRGDLRSFAEPDQQVQRRGDAPAVVVREQVGPDQAAGVEVLGQLAGGRLELGWTLSTAVHHRATIEHLAGQTLDQLRALTASVSSS